MYEEIPLSLPAFGRNTVTWTIPYETLTSIPHVKLRVGDQFPALGVNARLASEAGNFVVVDTLRSNVSYRLGS